MLAFSIKLYLFMPVLVLGLFCSCLDKPASPYLIQVEAESGTWTDLEKLPEADASGGYFLRMQASGQVDWKVNVSDSGWYNLVFRYRAPGGEKEQIVVKNGRAIPTGFSISSEWNLMKRAVALRAGENHIALKKSWGYMDIDYLAVAPVTLPPELVPSRNQVYLDFPRDLEFKLNFYGRKLEQVRLDGKNILQPLLRPYPHQEDAWKLTLPQAELARLTPESHRLVFFFDRGDTLVARLDVSQRPQPSPLTVIVPDIEHGSSVLLLLPTGKTLLVDCGKDWVRDQRLIPMLDHLGIETLDYLILTHYHEDHDSGDRGQTIRQRYHVGHFIDNQTWSTGTELAFEDTRLKVLNSYADGSDENNQSLSFRLEYNDFVYTHGADIYGDNQDKIRMRFPSRSAGLQTDVFYANHHFHGSVSVDYLRTLEPKLVLIQSEQAIYARSAYMYWFREQTETYLRQNSPHYLEDLPAVEVGHTVIRVRSDQDWTYETHRDFSSIPLGDG